MITQYTDELKQEKTNQERDVQVKTKWREECTKKWDQVMKAAQVNLLEVQPPSQAQRVATNMPSIADKAVSTLLFFMCISIKSI